MDSRTQFAILMATAATCWVGFFQLKGTLPLGGSFMVAMLAAAYVFSTVRFRLISKAYRWWRHWIG